MPYFKDIQTLFIHIPKNAGRSIESALLPSGLTPDSGRRSLVNRSAHAMQIATSSRIPRAHLLGTLDTVLVAQHLTYLEIELLGLLPRETLDTATSFCVVRNPYDRVLSSLRHFSERFDKEYKLTSPIEVEKALAFWSELDSTDHNLRAHRRPQSDYVCNANGKSVIDEILRFENIDEDFRRLCRRLSLTSSSLPWIGPTLGAKKRFSYRDYYTEAGKSIVSRIYEADIDTFGYTF